ncbi:MAG: SLC13 family permease [Anaerolineae bacterium]|nr:SLC13 family permease [Anaerolineae bacterium]
MPLMTPDMWITLLILVVALILFVTEIVRLDVVALGVMIALMVTGILTIEEGLAGFSNKAVISIAALFIVGGAIFQTGLAGAIAARILKIAGGNQMRLLIVLMASTAVMSAFISSTGVVALMLPAVVSLSRRMGMPISRLLIPLAFSALMGGALTLIGTPPNLLVSEALSSAGYAPFDFFSFAPIGLLLLAVSMIYMVSIGRYWLPERKAEATTQSVITPGELFTLYELPGSLFRLRVQDDSPLVGRSLGDSELRQAYDLNVVSIINGASGEPSWLTTWPRSGAITRQTPRADTQLQTNDVLLVQGHAEDVGRASGALKLAIVAAEPVAEGDIITNEVGIAEVLLRPRSPLIGKTLSEIQFGTVYRLTVMEIRRPGTDAVLSVKDTPLKFGDVLLVQGEWKHIFNLKHLRQDFIVMGEPEALEFGAFTQPRKAPIALLLMIGMVLLVALNILDLAPASLIAALGLVVTGCLKIDDAYETIDLRSLVLMAGMLPMGAALEKVGLVELFAGGFVNTLGQLGLVPVLAGLFVLTVVLTQVLSNTATTVLIAPLALVTAQRLGAQPQAFLMAVAVASSMAFATPLASPVNTLVIGAGNYKFNDYVRIGVPLIVIGLVVSLLVLPWLFPLT